MLLSRCNAHRSLPGPACSALCAPVVPQQGQTLIQQPQKQSFSMAGSVAMSIAVAPAVLLYESSLAAMEGCRQAGGPFAAPRSLFLLAKISLLCSVRPKQSILQAHPK